jgi:hypothetical protein
MKSSIDAAKKLKVSNDEFECLTRDCKIELVSTGAGFLIQKEDYQQLKNLLKKKNPKQNLQRNLDMRNANL